MGYLLIAVSPSRQSFLGLGEPSIGGLCLGGHEIRSLPWSAAALSTSQKSDRSFADPGKEHGWASALLVLFRTVGAIDAMEYHYQRMIDGFSMTLDGA